MKKIANIKFTQFNAILQSFNAPYLTMLSACVGYMDIKTCFATISAACDTINSHWAEEESQILGEPKVLGLADECAWVFSWETRSGNIYRFGLQDGTNHYTYFVEYPDHGEYQEDVTMEAMIEYLALGTPIPEGWFSCYPYKDNAYFAKAVADWNAKEKAGQPASRNTTTKTKRRGK